MVSQIRRHNMVHVCGRDGLRLYGIIPPSRRTRLFYKLKFFPLVAVGILAHWAHAENGV